MAWRKTSKEPFISAIVERERDINSKSALRECVLSMWRVDIHQALRMCQDRHIEVNAFKASYVSVDMDYDPWPS